MKSLLKLKNGRVLTVIPINELTRANHELSCHRLFSKTKVRNEISDFIEKELEEVVYFFHYSEKGVNITKVFESETLKNNIWTPRSMRIERIKTIFRLSFEIEKTDRTLRNGYLIKEKSDPLILTWDLSLRSLNESKFHTFDDFLNLIPEILED